MNIAMSSGMNLCGAFIQNQLVRCVMWIKILKNAFATDEVWMALMIYEYCNIIGNERVCKIISKLVCKECNLKQKRKKYAYHWPLSQTLMRYGSDNTWILHCHRQWTFLRHLKKNDSRNLLKNRFQDFTFTIRHPDRHKDNHRR